MSNYTIPHTGRSRLALFALLAVLPLTTSLPVLAQTDPAKKDETKKEEKVENLAAFEVTGSRIEERGHRTDEIIEAVTLLLTKPNVSYSGRYYSFRDVTIDPRPPRMPAIWVSGGSRVPDPGEHDVPVIAKTVMDRIVKAGHWLSRCSGTQEWVKRDWLQLQAHARGLGRDPKSLTFGHCNFIHLVEDKSHDKAVARSRAPYVRAMGTHRSWEHLQECYMVGSIDRINARIHDLAGAGLKYLVLGPVTDDPAQIDLLAKRVMPAFR